jgi:hypothetical protein
VAFDFSGQQEQLAPAMEQVEPLLEQAERADSDAATAETPSEHELLHDTPGAVTEPEVTESSPQPWAGDDREMASAESDEVLDEHLSKLRAALAELSAAFAPPASPNSMQKAS